VKDTLRSFMLHVTRLTRSGRLREATDAIQRALGGRKVAPHGPNAANGHTASPFSAPPAASPFSTAEADVAVEDNPNVIDVDVRIIEDEVAPEAPPDVGPGTAPAAGETLDGEFIAGSFTNQAGTRVYKLYVPPGAVANATPLPLVVMLHGCKQNPDDFAAGTGMNRHAQGQPCLVLYPGQTRAVNQLGCWNWFKAGDQEREHGEPSIIADMTRHIAATYPVDPNRIYVAGLSAGGAMSAIMANAYPELYAAAGVHSGLPHAAAHDLMSALNAMRQGPSMKSAAAAGVGRHAVPTIVFHGDRDTTVHPSNGDQVIAQIRGVPVVNDEPDGAPIASDDVTVESGQTPGGRAYTRTVHRDAEGRTDAEHWLVHGAGHAWSGGSPAGSYTDPLGPDASREMLRFFAEHPMRD